MPWLFFPADHELAVTRGGAPVHPAQRVAHPVGAGRDVIVTGCRRDSHPAFARAEPFGSGVRGWQRHDPRCDDKLASLVERPGYLHHAEGVGDPHIERSDVEPAAHVRADPVAQLAAAATLDALQHEAWLAAEQVR